MCERSDNEVRNTMGIRHGGGGHEREIEKDDGIPISLQLDPALNNVRVCANLFKPDPNHASSSPDCFPVFIQLTWAGCSVREMSSAVKLLTYLTTCMYVCQISQPYWRHVAVQHVCEALVLLL